MLWFNFIPSLIFISLCFWVWLCMITSLKQREIKFKPRIKFIEPQHTQSFIKPVFPGYYKLPCFPFYQKAFPAVQPLALLNLDQHLEINAGSREKRWLN